MNRKTLRKNRSNVYLYVIIIQKEFMEIKKHLLNKVLIDSLGNNTSNNPGKTG